MISRPHIPILSRLRRILFGFVLAAGLGGWTSAKAGLIINATAGDISTPSPNMIGGGNITTIFNQAVAYWEMAFPDPAQTWTLDLTYNWGVLGEDQVARLTPLTPLRGLEGSEGRRAAILLDRYQKVGTTGFLNLGCYSGSGFLAELAPAG